jgi:ATP synthase protein I
MSQNNERDTLEKSVRRHRARRAKSEQDGQGSLARDLTWMGGIAWLVVTPLLLGAFLGRMIDRFLGSGVAVTAALIFLGACAGGYLAWRRMQEP